MAFFAGLVAVYLLAWLVSSFGFAGVLGGAMPGVVAAAIMFFLVGLAHFLRPRPFEAIVPLWFPYKKAANYLSGLSEMVLGAGLLFTQARVASAWGLITLLVFIFPANISDTLKKRSPRSIARLFFQPIYIWWVWWFCIKNF